VLVLVLVLGLASNSAWVRRWGQAPELQSASELRSAQVLRG